MLPFFNWISYLRIHPLFEYLKKMGKVLAIKNELIYEIQWVEDTSFLEGILALVKQRSAKSPHPVYQLTREQNDALESAMRSMDEGNFVTHEDANAEIEKWLEE